MKKGDEVEARSGTQGWVKGIIVDEVDIFARVPGGIITQGQLGFKVRFTEGKHQGEVIKLPENYIRPVTGMSAIWQRHKEALTAESYGRCPKCWMPKENCRC